MKYRLTKLKDNKFEGRHPNDIFEGYIKEGLLMLQPEIGKVCQIQNFRTSTITKINDDLTFETLNSTYKLELISLQ